MHFQGEQHGKGPVDQLFGWGCCWIEDFLQQKPIHGLKDLIQCYRAGAQAMVNSDPDGPKFYVAEFDPGEYRPDTRTFFHCPGFLITRTYCLHTDLAPDCARGIRPRNKLFSDSQGKVLTGWFIETRQHAGGEEEQQGEGDEHVEDVGADPKKWRRGFWNYERSWEGTGPKPGEINEVVRRHIAQKSAPPVEKPFRSEIEKALSAAALRLQNAAIKKRRQSASLRHAAAAASASSSSSSSTSSSSSDSESSENP